MSILAAIAALLLSAAAQPGESPQDPPQDPRCPHTDMGWPRGPDTVCIGGTRRRYGFAFIYPRAAERIPAMMTYFHQQAAAHERWMRTQADEICDRFEADGGVCPTAALVYEQGWSLDADLPALAAASSMTTYSTLGLRDGHNSDTILIDRRSNRRIALGDLFTNPGGGLALTRRAFCGNLRAQVRARRRTESRIPVADVACTAAGLDRLTLCAEHGRIVTMFAEVSPPIVSVWPESDYRIEFAVTPAMIAALKPAYRASFGRSSHEPTADHGLCAR